MENILRLKREKNTVQSFSTKYENGFFIISFWNTSVSYLFCNRRNNSYTKIIDDMEDSKKKNLY